MRPVLLCILLVFGSAVPASAQQLKVDGISTLETILNERMKLKRGHFVAKGTFSGLPTTGISQLEVWFDGDVWKGEWTNKLSFEGINSGVTRVLLDGDKSYVQVNGSDVQVFDRKTAKKYVHYFDVRSIGLALTAELETGYSVAELIRSNQTGKQPLVVEQLPDHKLKIIRGPFQRSSYYSVIIDPERGSCAMEATEITNGKTNQSTVTEWKKAGDVWVPLKSRLEMNGELRSTLDFEWKSINEPIDAAAFDLSSAFPGSRLLVTKVGDRVQGVPIGASK